MKQEPFVIERTVNAPVARVWNALSNKDAMKQWYFDVPDFQPEVGCEFSFTGKGSKGEEYVHLCRVTEVIPERKLAYTWSYRDYTGESLVTFELTPDGENRTHVRLTHEGLHTFPNLPDFAPTSFAAGWNELIGKLLPGYVEA